MPLEVHDVESILLRAMASSFEDCRLNTLELRVRERLTDPNEHPSRFLLMNAVWALVARRLAYIDYSQPSPGNWSLCLTERGSQAARDSNPNPDDVPLYLRRVATDIPDLSNIPRFYLEEALRAYSSDCFSASTMMLGVAAEAVFYEAASPFAKWIDRGGQAKLSAILAKPQTMYIQKFVEFQKRITAEKGNLPQPLQQNLDLNINSV